MKPLSLFAEAARVLRFALAGFANTLLGGGVILVLAWGCRANPFVANAGGFTVGIIIGFFLNRSFVFRAGRSSAPVPRYGATIVVAFIGNQLVLAACNGWLPPLPGEAVLAQVAAMATYTAISFLLCRLWVFHRVDVPPTIERPRRSTRRARSRRPDLAKPGRLG